VVGAGDDVEAKVGQYKLSVYKLGGWRSTLGFSGFSFFAGASRLRSWVREDRVVGAC
jgi:hypothetical protein